VTLTLPQGLRDKLKIPLGILIPDNQTTKDNVLSKIPPDSVIITVGDATSEKMLGYGIVPRLQIVDGLEKRQKRVPPISSVRTVYCDNPPAQITQQSVDTIRDALDSSSPTRILVAGEEDLLVIPACVYAPENSVVLYGQPNEGLVVVPVTDEIRNKTKELLDLIRSSGV